MKARTEAKRFCSAIDAMHAAHGAAFDWTQLPGELSNDLAVAHSLLALDFTPRSAQLPALQVRILGHLSSWDGKGFLGRSRSLPFRIAVDVRKPLPIAALSLGLILVLVQCLTPGGIPAAGKAVGHYITSTLKLGRATAVVTVDDARRPPRAPSKGIEWSIDTPIGSVSAEVPNGAPRDGWHYRTFAEARIGAPDFAFLSPSFVPDGYQLSGVLLSPDRDWLIATYTSQTDPDIVFVAHNDAHGVGMRFFNGGDDVVKLSIGEAPAAWVGARSLVWEQGSASYGLGGKQLGQALAVRMAESFR
jgi:hypothetical protein